MEAEQLQGDDGEDALQPCSASTVLGTSMYCHCSETNEMVLSSPFSQHQDGLALAGLDLLEGVQALLIEAIPNHHLDDGSVFVEKGERPVLQFPGLDVGELLDLERPLHAHWVVKATAHHQHRLGLVQFIGDLEDLLVLIKQFLDQFIEVRFLRPLIICRQRVSNDRLSSATRSAIMVRHRIGEV